jgi:large subunit ribosomal protein L15
MLTLNSIIAQPGATEKKKRRGRGYGSGLGKTAGRGHKGQKARTGGTVRIGFEGGQTPLFRRLPKHGFTNPGRVKTAIVNLADLERKNLTSLKELNLASLKEAGYLKGVWDRLAVLATGDVKRALKVSAHRVSAAAKEKIEKAGGTVELIVIEHINLKKKGQSEKSKAKK